MQIIIDPAFAVILQNYTIDDDELFLKWSININLCQPHNYYLIRHNVSITSSELIVNTNNVILLGVLPGKFYYVDISLIKEGQGFRFYIQG